MISGRPNLAPDPAPSSPPGIGRWLTGPVAAAVVLVAFYAALLASVHDKSATFDEPGHAFAGVTYWKTGDYRFDPENGNLPQRWFGLALMGFALPTPPSTSPGWTNADNWTAADNWFNRSGHDVTAILLRGRAAAGLIAVALGAVIWSWSRRLFGPGGGIVALLLYVTNPVVLAHGALMTSDLAAALGFAVTLRCFWTMLQQPTARRVALSAVAMAALFLTKMSAVLILPVAAALAVIHLATRTRRAEGSSPAATSFSRVSRVLGLGLVAHVAIITFATWAAFGFRFAAVPTSVSQAARFHVPWEALFDQPPPAVVLGKLDLNAAQQAQITEIFRTRGASPSQWTYGASDTLEEITQRVLAPPERTQLESELRRPPAGLAARLVSFARERRLLPEACLYGWAHVWKFSRDRLAYFRGEIRSDGWRSYFPWLFAVKTPLATFVLLGLALAAWTASSQRRVRWSGAAPLFVFVVIYGVAAILSQINLGIRHLLPVYPALFIGGGAAGLWFGELATRSGARGVRLASVLLLPGLAVEAALRFPNYLAYFNGLVRPAEAYRQVVDSSLDWGQELPALKRELSNSSPTERRYLAYFGAASPRHYQLRATPIFSFLDYDRAERPVFKIIPGPQDDASLVAALKAMPEYDPALIYPVRAGPDAASLVLKRGSELRLDAGTYYVSASLLPPVHYPNAHGWWSTEHEANYQRLRAATQPLLSDERRVRAAAVNRFDPDTWNRIFREFDEYRFARLAASLRRRRPDSHVNFAILTFRLAAADLETALNGPPPLGQ
jgi:hypothetical protein